MRDRGLGEIEHRVDIHLERQLPFFVGNIFDRLEGSLVRGIVDENVKTAQLGNSPFDDSAAM